MNLPAYIQAKQGLTFAQRAIANVGAGSGPYLSIEGGRFTFVDAAGNQQPVQTLFVDVVIVDVNDHLSKMYYTNAWDPNNPLPPACFSDNGIAPSVGASQPQALTCVGCDKNQWGSKISAMGSKVKACRDEQKLAIIVPGMPGNMFRATVPPNSLSNFRAYVAKFLNAGFDLDDVLTRLSFEPGVQGTLLFEAAPNPWLTDDLLAVRAQARASKASDMLVGRLDRPRQAALPAPTETIPQGAQQPVPFVPAPAPTAASPSTQAAPAPTQTAAPAPAASPSEPPARRRRTRAQIEADNAAQSQPQASTTPQMAPFRPSAPPQAAFPGTAAPQGASPSNFGIQPGVEPNAEVQAAIASIFGPG